MPMNLSDQNWIINNKKFRTYKISRETPFNKNIYISIQIISINSIDTVQNTH